MLHLLHGSGVSLALGGAGIGSFQICTLIFIIFCIALEFLLRSEALAPGAFRIERSCRYFFLHYEALVLSNLCSYAIPRRKWQDERQICGHMEACFLRLSEKRLEILMYD